VPSHAASRGAALRRDGGGSGAPSRHEVHDAHANLDALLRIYRVPEHRSADTPALEVLNIIVGQGASSRLNVAVVRREKGSRRDRRDPQSVRLTQRSRRCGSPTASVNQGRIADRMDTLIGVQLDSIRTYGISAAELEKAKNALRAGFIGNRETTLGKAEELHQLSHVSRLTGRDQHRSGQAARGHE